MKLIKKLKWDRRHEPKRMLGVTRMDIMRGDHAPNRPNWYRRMQRFIAHYRSYPFEYWLRGGPQSWKASDRLPFRKRIGVRHAHPSNAHSV